MKLNKSFKLEKVASPDPTRTAIQNILIHRDGDKTVAVSTDGKSMAIVPVTVESDTEIGLISPQSLIAGRKVCKRMEETEMTVNGNIAFHDGSALPRPTQDDCGPFPQWQQIRNDALNAPTKFKIRLNARRLWDLAQALGNEGNDSAGITLEFSGNRTPIRVTCGEADGKLGILMPMIGPEDCERA